MPDMPYQPDAAFAGLFRAFTGDDGSIGSALTQQMQRDSDGDPLLVSTASDIALFPGAGAPARIESFRTSTRGFIEMTAVSHLPLALAYLGRLRELQGDGGDWRARLHGLVEQARRTRAANTEAMWREHVALQAFAGLEPKIVDMVAYTIDVSVAYAERALAEPARLDAETLRRDYYEAPASVLPVPMNDVMYATFCLAYVDIAWRIGNWLRAQAIDWPRAMVLVSGQSGRPTAGVTWGSNNLCDLIWKTAEGALPPQRLYVAPHAPGFSVAALPDAAGLAALEQQYRRVWCHTRASVEVARRMFAGHESQAYEARPGQDMPPLRSADDRAGIAARLRRIMEDPQQLLSNCVADYVVDQLRAHGNRPRDVVVPGFSNVDYPAR